MEEGSKLCAPQKVHTSSVNADVANIKVEDTVSSDLRDTGHHDISESWPEGKTLELKTLRSPSETKAFSFEKEELTSSVICVPDASVENTEAIEDVETDVMYLMEPSVDSRHEDCCILEHVMENQSSSSAAACSTPVEWIGMVGQVEKGNSNQMVIQSPGENANDKQHEASREVKIQQVVGHNLKGEHGSEAVTQVQHCTVEDISSIIREGNAVSIVIISDNTDWLQHMQTSGTCTENSGVDNQNLAAQSDCVMEAEAVEVPYRKDYSTSENVKTKESRMNQESPKQGFQEVLEKEQDVLITSKSNIHKRRRQFSSSDRETKIQRLKEESDKEEGQDLLTSEVNTCEAQMQYNASVQDDKQMVAPLSSSKPFPVVKVIVPNLAAPCSVQSGAKTQQAKSVDSGCRLVRTINDKRNVTAQQQSEACHVSVAKAFESRPTVTDPMVMYSSSTKNSGAKDEEHWSCCVQDGKQTVDPAAVSVVQGMLQDDVAEVGVKAQSFEPQVRMSELEVSVATDKGDLCGEGGVMYRCTECDYVSPNKHYYKQHVDLVHNTTRPYKCPYCDYAGKRTHALREHMVVHSAQRPFSCTQCNATFRKKGHLTNHTKLHATTSGGAGVVGVNGANPATAVGGSQLVKVFTAPPPSSGPITFVAARSAAPAAAAGAKNTGSLLTTTILEKACGTRAGGVAHILEAKGISEDKASNTSGFWCAICNHAMADAKTFETHLLAVHKTNRLYMCESCDYVAADKATIMAHLPTHLTSSTTTGDLVPGSANNASLACASNYTVIYMCADCGFESQTLQTLRTHALKHNAEVSVAPNVLEIQKDSTVNETSEQQKQKALCSVCGLVADSTDAMRTHMWTHIAAGGEAAAEGTNKPVESSTSEELHVALPVSGKNPVQILQDAVTAPTGQKVLPHNAAFQCTDCSFVSRDASLFIKHMLQHKTQQSQASRAQGQATGKGTNPAVSTTAEGAVVQISAKTSQSYRVRPVTTENTCQNADSSPFVHDDTTGRFRCTICGYTCEYQRTIKAHIWKHSGHQQVDYPIFQNGPLSVYDEPATTCATSADPTPLSSGVAFKSSAVLPEHQKAPIVVVTKTAPNTTPHSVQFITRDGVPTMAPSGIYKLTPVSHSSASNPILTSATLPNKQIVLRVQSGSADGTTASANVGLHQVTQQSKPATEVKTEDGNSLQRQKADEKMLEKGNSRSDVETVRCSGALGPESSKLRHPVLKTLGGQEALPVQGQLDSSPSNSEASQTTAVKGVPVAKVLQLPTSQVITMGLSSAAPISQQKSSSLAPVPVKGVSQGQVTPSKVIYLKVIPEQKKEGVVVKDKALDPDGFFGKSEKNSDQPEASAVPRIAVSLPQGPQKAVPLLPNVVVEVVPPVSPGLVLTGLQSRPNSPRVLQGLTVSAATSDCNGQGEAAPLTGQASDKNPSLEKTEAERTGMVTRSRSRWRACQEKDKPGDSGTCLQQGESREQVDGSVTEARNSATETPQDSGPLVGQSNKSELAVTLLSLLQKDPGLDPANTQDSLSTDDTPDANAESQELPSRPPSTVSDTDSASKDTMYGDAGSEELMSEGESAAVGKAHTRGGQGICSSLLAVIEQLRERSKSESDVEERSIQSHPPPKKRSSRGRRRKSSQDDALVMEDYANIEHVTADDGVAYRCKLCHYTSSRTPLIRLHMRTHRPKEPFECSLCPLVADSSEELQEHMMQHCKARTYACKFCPQSFNHKSTLRAHMRAHNDADPFLCSFCDFETSSPLEYRAHMQKHTGRALLQCSRCPMVLASRYDLGVHIRSGCSGKGSRKGVGSSDAKAGDVSSSCGTVAAEEAAGNGQLACLRCGFTTLDERELKEHASGHLVPKSVGAMEWMEVDGSKEPLQCALCDFTAVSTRSLKSHMKRHANDQRYVQQPLEQYKCSLCGYICHHLPSLKSHMWRHASDANYSYQFTNDVINAAIDYDTRADPSATSSSSVAAEASDDAANEPKLLEKVFSAERRIMEGQLSKLAGGSRPVCWVTFCCCQCGFETINKAKLNLHMRTHADIINRALRIGSVQGASASDSAAAKGDQRGSGTLRMKVIYEPV